MHRPHDSNNSGQGEAAGPTRRYTLSAQARDWALAQGVTVRECGDDVPVPRGEVIVDALLGTGLSGEPSA